MVGAVRLALVAGAVCGASVVVADDLNPPPYRGAPGSVFVHWDFRVTASGPVAVEFGPDPDGAGPIMPNPQVPPGLEIFTPDPNKPFTQYRFTMPNWIDPFPIKLMRIQITWTDLLDDGAFPSPFIKNIRAFEGSGEVDPTSIVQTFQTTPDVLGSGPNGTTLFFFSDWEIRPNPDFEIFDVNLPADGGLRLDQVVFDSISFIPSPGGAALLGLGGLAMLRRRRTPTA